MKPLIQFINGLKEKTLPLVKLTKSKNGTTGTATFLFIYPSIFEEAFSSFDSINGMVLIWENKKIITNDINIFFKNGKPFLLKAIFIFKNTQEWFRFFQFMKVYSKETGLLFSENN
jgi:photosystem II protein